MGHNDADAFSHEFGFSFTDPLGGVHSADVDLSGAITAGPGGISGSFGITEHNSDINPDGSEHDHSMADASAFHGGPDGSEFAHGHADEDHFTPPE
jgi:hypothetical protein